MSVKVSKQTITVESFSWAAGVNATREEAGRFLVDLSTALGTVKMPVAELKASATVVDPLSVEVKRVVATRDPSKADIKLAGQAIEELYGAVKYRPVELELAGRIAAAGFGIEELTTAIRVVTMLSTFNNLKQDKLQRDLGLRPFQFERLFEVFFEGTFTSVQREVSLMRGARMLEEGTIEKISDVGKALGYSKAGFRSAFGSLFGISPNDYRIQYRKARAKEALAELVHA